eukprot:SAG22_NODE_153_length_17315_cov_69.981935_2_plen_201_part_00
MQAAGWLLAVLLVFSSAGMGTAGPGRKQRVRERNRDTQPMPAPPSQPISAAAAERAVLRQQIAAMKLTFDGRGAGDPVSPEEWARVQALAGETFEKIDEVTDRLSSIDNTASTVLEIQDKLIKMNGQIQHLKSAGKFAAAAAMEEPLSKLERSASTIAKATSEFQKVKYVVADIPVLENSLKETLEQQAPTQDERPKADL